MPLADTTWKVGIASVVGCFLFCVGIIVMFRGQKLFFTKEEDPAIATPTAVDPHHADAESPRSDNGSRHEPNRVEGMESNA